MSELADAPQASSIDDGALTSAGAQLADAIAQDIADSKAPEGTIFAFESELMALHAVGRPVLRQAVRILEERGIAFMKRGNQGGLVVAEPSADFAGRSLSIVIESLTQDPPPLSFLSTAVDTHLFLHSSRRLDRHRCDQLEQLVRRLDRLPVEDFLRIRAIPLLRKTMVAASREPTVVLAHATSAEYLLDLIPDGVESLLEEQRVENWRLAKEVAEAVIAGDVARMFDCRRRQVEMYKTSWRKKNDAKTGDGPGDDNRPELQFLGNRAERLAREILREIRARHWKPGERIGGASELQDRYRAGENTLRQAVLMLQEHTAVYVERGRYGGLFITLPDRDKAITRANAFLTQGHSPAAVDVEALLVNVVLEALETESPIRSTDLQKEMGVGPNITFCALTNAIAKASKNPTLQLFSEILLPFIVETTNREISSEAVLQAFASGDRSRTRRVFLDSAKRNPNIA